MYLVKNIWLIAPAALLVVTLVFLPLYLHRQKQGKDQLRLFSWLGLIGALVLAAGMLLLHSPVDLDHAARMVNLVWLHWLQLPERFQEFFQEVLPNILLFVPAGFFVPLCFCEKRRFISTAAVALLLSLCLESLQYMLGWTFDIDDLVCNTLGGCPGWLLFYEANRHLQTKAWWRSLADEPAGWLPETDKTL